MIPANADINFFIFLPPKKTSPYKKKNNTRNRDKCWLNLSEIKQTSQLWLPTCPIPQDKVVEQHKPNNQANHIIPRNYNHTFNFCAKIHKKTETHKESQSFLVFFNKLFSFWNIIINVVNDILELYKQLCLYCVLSKHCNI